MEHGVIKNINTHVDNFLQNTTCKSYGNSAKLIFMLYSVCLISLMLLQCYVASAVISGITIAMCIYIIIAQITKKLTVYNAIAVNAMSLLYCVLFFNVGLYSVQNALKYYDLWLFVVVILFQVLCLYVGFLYAMHCVKKGKVYKKHVAPVSVVAGIGPTLTAHYMVRYWLKATSVEIQNVVITVVITVVAGITMFYIGMYYIFAMYCIVKYKLSDRNLPSKM